MHTMIASSCNSAKTTSGPFQKYHEALSLFHESPSDVPQTELQKVPRTVPQTSQPHAVPGKTVPQNDESVKTSTFNSHTHDHDKESWYTAYAKTPVDDKNGSGYYEKYHSAPVFVLLLVKLQSVMGKALSVFNPATYEKFAKTPVHDKKGSGYYEKYHSAPVFVLLLFKLQSVLAKALSVPFGVFNPSTWEKFANTPVDDKNGSGYYQKYHSAPVFVLLLLKLQRVLGKTVSGLFALCRPSTYQAIYSNYANTPIDDKHGSGYYEKYHSAPVFVLLLFKLQRVVGKAVPALFGLFGNSSFSFAVVYTLLGLIYISMGGHPLASTGSEKLLNLMSISMEVFGLLIVRHKIQQRKSVEGISGMTMLMYAACYTVRIWLNLPDSWSFNVMELELEASFGIFSLVLVLDCLRSVFVTYRNSYQEELDVLHVKYLIPGCFILALVLHAHFHSWGTLFGYMWTSCLYMDVLALMPQVVMMARSEGKVAAPIAHFVAATFLSRIEDLSDSLFFKGNMQSDDYFSYSLIVFFQALHLLIVADFMYYYVKALTSGAGLKKNMEMDVIEV